MAVLPWILRPLKQTMWTRLALLAAVAVPRLLHSLSGAGQPALAIPPSKLKGSKVSLRESARRIRSSLLSRDDVEVSKFISGAEEFVRSVERFGDFTRSGVDDARKNLRRVDAGRGGLSSMRAMLMNEVRRGSRRPEGGPARSSPAEALLWSRLSLKLWVEIFKDHLRARSKQSLQDATRNGFQRSLARYLDRFGRAAFNVASRQTPDWDEVRQRTHLGCDNGVCSDEQLTGELKTFVEQVEPVLDRMTTLQKSVGLEDPRTP